PQEIPMPMEKLEKPNASLDTESHISVMAVPLLFSMHVAPCRAACVDERRTTPARAFRWVL
ncbi:hypothetical protein, partial [Burkholderia ubonensis]|uniref:hypothetical protein n=1 Tax=Burkholderia ubonensis TaxID=101571 RepID=UPI001E4BACEC